MAEELKDLGIVTVCSVIGFVFGLIGMLGSFIPCIGSFAFFIGIPAAIIAAIGLGIAYSKKAKKTFAIVAVTISLIGVVISGVQYFSIISASKHVARELDKMAQGQVPIRQATPHPKRQVPIRQATPQPKRQVPIRQATPQPSGKILSPASLGLSSDQLKTYIIDYYDNRGIWRRQFKIHSIEKMRIENIGKNRYYIHTKYEYVPVRGGNGGFDQRIFVLEKSGNYFNIIGMGGNSSAKF